ncbi:MAG TPA: GTP cyclohydrolase II [Candidatus Omnitrophota bacterium]|nr:GTP cyclohydrolase II [Candidatus Omnitrophota bacterium]
MTRPLDVSPRPPAPASAPLIAVDRAAAELRRGGVVAVRGADGAVIHALSVEAVTPETLARLGAAAEVAVTGRRAAVLGLAASGDAVQRLSLVGGFDAETIAALSDPCARDGRPDLAGLTVAAVAAQSGIAGAVALAKLARLLPAVAFAPAAAAAPGMLTVDAADIADYQHGAAHSLTIVSQARVPLQDAENARIVAFRPADGGIEHLAIVIGEPDCDAPVLARLHSECFTGDLLGSLRCDCGDQLRGAIAEISQAGSGVLLYLAQEGRGIGLVNKLRAYQLQDDGFDTLDANLQLGFDDDERLYQPAAQMLRLLGIGRVRLMTNNPFKVDALARHGIDVAERVPHVFPANDHNEGYLRTKATRGGHLF